MFGPSDGWDILSPDQQNDIIDAESETAPAPREDVAVAEVLAAHVVTFHGTWATCRCGWSVTMEEAPEGHDEPHRAHVAEALAPLIAERERAAAVEAWDAGAAVGDELARERTLLWADDQMQALPEHRTPVAHGKAELLTDLRRFLYRADRRAER